MLQKVLLVEDDPIAVMLCTKVIEKTGFAGEIETVFNGRMALDYYQNLLSQSETGELEDYPELILLDLNMPVMTGWEFLEEFIRNIYPFCPETRVVIISSSIVPEDRKKAGEYSVVRDFLSKPISVTDIEKLSADMG